MAVGCGVAVGWGVGVGGIGVDVGCGVAVARGVAVGWGVAVGRGVAVDDGVAVAVGCAPGVTVGRAFVATVACLVGVAVGCATAICVGIGVAVARKGRRGALGIWSLPPMMAKISRAQPIRLRMASAATLISNRRVQPPPPIHASVRVASSQLRWRAKRVWASCSTRLCRCARNASISPGRRSSGLAGGFLSGPGAPDLEPSSAIIASPPRRA